MVRVSQITDFREKPGNQYWPYWLGVHYNPTQAAAIVVSDTPPSDPAAPGAARARHGAAYNLFEGNQLLRGALGFRFSAGTYFNLVRGNRVDGVEQLLQDEGEKNLLLDPLGQGLASK